MASACADDVPVPSLDAGRKDAGFVFPDASFFGDAETGLDATGPRDLGSADADAPDLGRPDADVPDLGPRDTGIPSNCGAARAPVLGDLIVNEFLADPGPDLEDGDTNADGTRSATDDEFVELANVSADDLLLEGVTIQDAAGANRHTFEALTLGCGQVVVVFGGGDDQSAEWLENWYLSTSGGLSLNNDADEIRLGLVGGAADELGVTTYGSEANVDQSLVRDPDLDPGADFVPHTVATGSDGFAFSPGTRIDGSDF